MSDRKEMKRQVKANIKHLRDILTGIDMMCELDNDNNVAMLNDDGKLESFLSCSNCGDEGLRSEVEFQDDYTCKECYEKEK